MPAVFRHLLVFLLCCVVTSASAQPRLDVVGADEDLRDAIEAASLLFRETDEPRSRQDTVAAARADYARIIGALYDRGYFAAEVSIRVNGREAGGLSPFAAPADVSDLAIRVDPGPVFQFGRAEIGPLAAGDTPIKDFQTGAPATVPVLRDSAQRAIDAWRDAGHATAGIERQSLQALNREARLNATIRIAPGPQLDFGALRPTGLDRLSASRFQEIAGLPRGEVFSPDELNRAANRLRRSGVFSSVALTEAEPNPDGTIDIDAAVVEAPLRRIGFGAEVSTTDGGRLTAFWLHRNLSGNGDRLRFDAEISGIGQQDSAPDYELSANFSRPASATPDTTFRATATLAYQDEETFEESVFEISAGVEQQITDRLSAEARLGLRYSQVSDGFGDRDVTLLTLPLGVTWDGRDDPLDATGGLFADLDLTPFYATSSAETGVRLEFDGRAYTSFGADDGTRLAARLQLGSVFGGDVRDLPPDFLFFSGGGGTVRGQDFRSLGATQLGTDAGGRGFIGLSAELRQAVTETIGAVAFYDAGYISQEALFDDSGTWHSGAGLGLRYNTPFGAIRLDVATPVDGPGASEDVYLYIGIGQSF
ncbi:MAG: BamA/TamA family outer membrane protein [Pseudomonadota bacterium]